MINELIWAYELGVEHEQTRQALEAERNLRDVEAQTKAVVADPPPDIAAQAARLQETINETAGKVARGIQAAFLKARLND